MSTRVANKVGALTASPAYIDSAAFALALVTTLETAAAGKPLPEILAEIPDPQLRTALTTLMAQARGDRDAFQAALGRWFDDAMNRVSGWYKRYTQVIGFVMAFVVCVALNANALRIGAALWRAPSLRAELAVTDQPSVTSAIDRLTQDALLGWDVPPIDPRTDPRGFASMVLGWLLVTGASLFGAPFWFDTLQRIAQIAGTGPADLVRKAALGTGDAKPPARVA